MLLLLADETEAEIMWVTSSTGVKSQCVVCHIFPLPQEEQYSRLGRPMDLTSGEDVEQSRSQPVTDMQQRWELKLWKPLRLRGHLLPLHT